MKQMQSNLVPFALIVLSTFAVACGDDTSAPVDEPPPTFARVVGSPGQSTFAGDMLATSTGLRVLLGQFGGVLRITSEDSLVANEEDDAYAIAFRDDGSVAWKRAIGGGSDESFTCGARDGSDNIFVGGFYTGATTIAGDVLPVNGLGEALVVRLSSNGTPEWAIGGGSTLLDVIRDIATTLDGDAVVCGLAGGSLSMAGESVGEATSGAGFVMRVSALGGGVWSSTATGTGTSECWGIARGSDGSFFVCGDYANSNVTVASSVLPNDGEYDSFVARFSAAGAGLTAHQIGGAGSASLRSIIAMGNGYVAIGDVSGANDFDVFSGAGNVTAVGNNDVVVARWSQPGVLQWVKLFGGAGDEHGVRIARSGDRILVTGTFDGTIVFGSRTLTTNGSADVFFAELDGNGNALSAGNIGSTAEDLAASVLGIGANVLVTGMVQGDSRFPDGQIKNVIGDRDVFIYQR